MDVLHVVLCCLVLFKALEFVFAVYEINERANYLMEQTGSNKSYYSKPLENSKLNVTLINVNLGRNVLHLNNSGRNQKIRKLKADYKLRTNSTTLPLLYKIHSAITRSKDAIWATISLTFMCIVLLIAVAQSQMWKDYHNPETHGIPLPNFNERVPFKEVMERKVRILKELFSKEKQKKKAQETELESLLVASEYE